MAIGDHLGRAGPAVFEERIKFRGGTFGPRHQPATVLEKVFFPEMIDYSFMVVRHPVTRLVSEYRYQRRSGLVQLSRFRMFGFDTWLSYSLHCLRRDPDWRVGHFRPQVAYECFECEVFKYEDGLDKVMQGVSRATGVAIPYETPPKNVSTYRPTRVSQASLDMIAATYAADFERFGYKVEMPQIKGVTGP